MGAKKAGGLNVPLSGRVILNPISQCVLRRGCPTLTLQQPGLYFAEKSLMRDQYLNHYCWSCGVVGFYYIKRVHSDSERKGFMHRDSSRHTTSACSL